MNLSSAVKTETVPLIVTILLPGALASSSYLWWLLQGAPPEMLAFLTAKESVATIGAIIVCLAVGFTIDSLGSYVEVYALDKRQKDYEAFMTTWWVYLKKQWQTDPIGQNYLRRVLVSFKFELNMFVACFLTIPGILLLYLSGIVTACRGCWTVLALLVLTILFFRFAKSSSELLAEVRKRLNEIPSAPAEVAPIGSSGMAKGHQP